MPAAQFWNATTENALEFLAPQSKNEALGNVAGQMATLFGSFKNAANARRFASLVGFADDAIVDGSQMAGKLINGGTAWTQVGELVDGNLRVEYRLLAAK